MIGNFASFQVIYYLCRIRILSRIFTLLAKTALHLTNRESVEYVDITRRFDNTSTMPNTEHDSERISYKFHSQNLFSVSSFQCRI
jgi:hypothetical protein